MHAGLKAGPGVVDSGVRSREVDHHVRVAEEASQCGVESRVGPADQRQVVALWVDRGFELRFEGAEWSTVGYLDVEDASGEVIDARSGQAMSEVRAERDPQATVFGLARRIEGQLDGRFLLHSVRPGPIRSGERCLVGRRGGRPQVSRR